MIGRREEAISRATASSRGRLVSRAVASLALSLHCGSESTSVAPPAVARMPTSGQARAIVPPPPAALHDSGGSSASPSPSLALGFDSLPGWRDDNIAEAISAFRHSCERMLGFPDARPIGPGGLAGTAGDWKPACRSLPAPDEVIDADFARAWFSRWFVPVAVAPGGNDRGLFTGYYEPELHGARRRSRRFHVPLYARPTDLRDAEAHGTTARSHRRRRVYFTRAQIVAGAVRRTARPIVWVDDAIDAFFLEIQGSGRVVLEDGSIVQLNYEASNGHPYVPLGRVLIEQGALEPADVSLQSIRAWLLAHPREAQSTMNRNPSYVFFRESSQGPTGAEGVVLTPGRSLAVDLRYMPLGVPLFVDLEPLEGVGPIRRLVVAQDTGGAIRGPVRGDVFWGAGPDAYDRAGRMRQQGRYWLLAPADIASRVRWDVESRAE